VSAWFRGRRATLIPLVSLLTVLLAGCSPNAVPRVVLPPSVGAALGAGGPLPEQLLEPPAVTAAQRQSAKVKRSVRVCDALLSLDTLTEPSVHDLKGLTKYAASMYGIFSSISLTREPADNGVLKEVPPRVAAALGSVQAELYAYMIRLGATKGLRDNLVARYPDRRKDADALALRYSQRSLLQLINSPYSANIRLLEKARPTMCAKVD
jgi:hypothetical protein